MSKPQYVKLTPEQIALLAAIAQAEYNRRSTQAIFDACIEAQQCEIRAIIKTLENAK